MKIIDLLNKIANGEEVPNKIKHWNKNYRYDSLSTDYEQIGGFDSLFKNLLIYEHDLQKCLNNEVEILEEEKDIEETNLRYVVCKSDFADLHIVDLLNNFFKENDDKINELVREVRKLKESK